MNIEWVCPGNPAYRVWFMEYYGVQAALSPGPVFVVNYRVRSQTGHEVDVRIPANSLEVAQRTVEVMWRMS